MPRAEAAAFQSSSRANGYWASSARTGVRAAARAFGLDFVPVAQEPYDLVLERESLELPLLQPLWALLLELTPPQIVDLLDLSYLEDVLTTADARRILEDQLPSRSTREPILGNGYPGYDTSVGWFQYEDSRVKQLARDALDRGFHAFKLKVGSSVGQRDIRRAFMLRDLAPDALIMLDANQQWTLPQAKQFCDAVRSIDPYWIEEPTHPDDIQAHVSLSRHIAPMRIALGEHVPNRVVFRNFMAFRALNFVQADCTRVAGVSEFLTVSLLAKKYGLPVVPHVGDMGQIHQHLVPWQAIRLGTEPYHLEYIPHLRERFATPIRVEAGRYRLPETPGSTTRLRV